MKKPRYRHAGNAALLMELGDEPSPELGLHVTALAQHFAQQAAPFITDFVVCNTSILIEYDAQKTTASKVVDCCHRWMTAMPPLDQLRIPSRLVEIPVCYNDRWTRECAEEYSRTVKKIRLDCEFLAEVNECASVDDLIKRHSSGLWRVVAIDFPGMPVFVQAGARNSLKAPKYSLPRMWTPKGTVVLGDAFTMIYPTITPDGHQMLGRSPLAFFDPDLFSSPVLDHSLTLLRVGDRVRFRPINEDEFLAIEASVAAKSYNLVVSDERELTLAELRSGSVNG